MRGKMAWCIGVWALALLSAWLPAGGYVVETTVPLAQACPAPDVWNLSSASPTQLQWSTSLAYAQQVLTVAPLGSAAQLTEIQSVIQTALNAWTGVDSTSANPNFVPGVVGAIGSTTTVDACTADDGSGVDGVNTICFNQSSEDFTIGVLAFTRTITANAPGVSVGASGPAAFAGQLLDSDTLFNNTGQVNFATPGVISTPQGVGSYDLASLLTHELGHYFGLDHSAVRRAIMYPVRAAAGDDDRHVALGRCARQPAYGRRSHRDARAVSESGGDGLSRHDYRARGAGESVCDGDISADSGGTDGDGNFRDSGGGRGRGYRRGCGCDAGRVELQCRESGRAF